MSKPITRSCPAARALKAMPTMPPAGPEKDGILALKSARFGQSARTLHEQQAHPGHFLGNSLDIAAQDG